MRNSVLLISFVLCLTNALLAQNVGIGTTTPQAKLHVNGTFKLQQGVVVNEISNDSTFTNASDSVLPTQLAVRKFMDQGHWVPASASMDSVLVLGDSISNQATLIWVHVQGNFAYCIRANSGLYIYDVSDPDSLVARGSSVQNMQNPQRVFVQGDYAYVTSFGNNQLNIYNISNPDAIVALGTTTQNLSGPWGIFVEGSYAYVASLSNNRFCVFNISNPNAITAVSFMTHIRMDGPEMVWKQGPYVWITSQFGNGTGFLHRYDVSVPSSPVLKGFSNEMLDRPHDVQTRGSYAFVTSQFNNSVVVFDGSNALSISAVASLSTGIENPNHLSIGDLYAYVTSGDPSGDIYEINIDNPLQPFLRPPSLQGYSSQNAAVCADGRRLFLAGAANHALWMFTRFPLDENLRVTRLSNGTYRFDPGVWQVADSREEVVLGNERHYDFTKVIEQDRIIYRLNGNVGIGTSAPKSGLHLTGDQKFSGGYERYLEFGAGIPGKETNAGKIYCVRQPELLNQDVLYIVGGGTSGHRKLKLWADEIHMTGALRSLGTLTYQKPVFYTTVAMTQPIGIFRDPVFNIIENTCQLPNGTFQPYPYHDNLAMLGAMRIHYDGAGSGLYMDPFTENSDFGFFLGQKDIEIFGIKQNGTWPMEIRTATGYFGMFASPDYEHRLNVGAYLTAFSIHTGGFVIHNTCTSQYLEFGSGIVNKHVLSGRITQWDNDAIRIFGAGVSETSRKIKFWAEGGMETNGDFHVQGVLQVNSIAVPDWEDLTASFQNGWQDYGAGYTEAAYYKDHLGVVHLRGLIANGLNQQNTVICNLPPAYRPAYGHMIFAVVNGVDTLGRVDIETDGDVVFRGSTNAFLSLDQIEFRTF